MSEPTFDQAAEDWTYALDILDEYQKAAADGSTGVVALEAAFRAQVRGTLAARAISKLNARSSGSFLQILGNAVGREVARSISIESVRQMALAANFAGAPNGTTAQVWRAVFDYMHANSKTINDPEDTYDAFSATTNSVTGGANVTDGQVLRLTVDEWGYKLIGWRPDTYVLECVKDQSNNAIPAFRSQWQLKAGTAAPSNLQLDGGAGLTVGNIFSLSEREARLLITNPCFTDFSQPSGTLTSLTGWAQNTGATIGENLVIDEVNFWRVGVDEQVGAALQFTGDETISPDLSGGGRVLAFPTTDRPYTFRFRVRRNASATGTITLRISDTIGSGGVSASLDLSTLSVDSWGELALTVGQNSWPTNFAVGAAVPQISASGLSGTANVSNWIAGPLSRVGRRRNTLTGRGALGQYLAVIEGQASARRGDRFQADDVAGGTRSVVNTWGCLVPELGYLPSATIGETVVDR